MMLRIAPEALAPAAACGASAMALGVEQGRV
jgi:hypothetical protein